MRNGASLNGMTMQRRIHKNPPRLQSVYKQILGQVPKRRPPDKSGFPLCYWQISVKMFQRSEEITKNPGFGINKETKSLKRLIVIFHEHIFSMPTVF